VRFAAAALVALLLIAGCGGDEEEPETTATTTPTETQTTATEETVTEPAVETATEPEVEPEPEAEVETETSPEDQPGGAGDEEPARSQALFTAAGGRVTPRVVRVPSFIAVRVELRARDAGPYTLTIGGQTIEVGEALNSMSVSLDGLRPGDAYVGRLGGQAAGRVRVEATAEPGP
jgi:ABC-type glycerol-3-phosphate transport system substrate-binding protein